MRESDELGIRSDELEDVSLHCISLVESFALTLPLAPWSWASMLAERLLIRALMPDFWSIYDADKLLMTTSLIWSRSKSEVDVVSLVSSVDESATML